ncbi:DUF4350 domain-containing protein [Novosphingobium olei]|uniref:DUF4350 domain-containing protein n=1 Tax=Novosphingobium olei TaxID=2728851 RepID=A0A7Y0BSJ8_9SPHN|nr:DUF4350 domain-containing protein [Novosphingobium olei]NML95820.1 DUF4350 domain-containing protein [Novosphingobium olei]
MNGQPFARGTLVAMLFGGLVAFVALLWSLGHAAPDANNGGGHAGGRGLNGFAALAAMLEADGFEVNRSRAHDPADRPGLLILTPSADAKGSDINDIVVRHRHVGPTLVITPKWFAMPIEGDDRAKRGWTRIVGTAPPEWPGFADDVAVKLAPARGWNAAGSRMGRLPDPRNVLSGSGKALVSLVRASDGRILAAFVNDSGSYPALEQFAGTAGPIGGNDPDLYPLVFVFEPDLLDNWGMADRATGLLARDLIIATADGRGGPVTFDLSLAGLGASKNLLTLAFEPPFLAATICLILAAAAAIWRALAGFGPRLVPGRAMAHGKSALVANAAALVRRSGRLHLIAPPYGAAARERLVLALGLPRGRAASDADTAIDRSAQARRPGLPSFAALAARLSAARRPDDIVRAARDIQLFEKDLLR